MVVFVILENLPRKKPESLLELGKRTTRDNRGIKNDYLFTTSTNLA
jgi:hypothetical protein